MRTHGLQSDSDSPAGDPGGGSSPGSHEYRLAVGTLKVPEMVANNIA